MLSIGKITETAAHSPAEANGYPRLHEPDEALLSPLIAGMSLMLDQANAARRASADER